VERRVAAVTPRATPIAGWAAISPLPPIISTRIGTTPIQMARPARSPVSVGAASLRHGYNVATRSGFEEGNRKSDCVTIRGNKQGGGGQRA
jgi:hypothetical protein